MGRDVSLVCLTSFEAGFVTAGPSVAAAKAASFFNASNKDIMEQDMNVR